MRMTNITNIPTDLPNVEGRYTLNAPLGKVGWFRTGGVAEVLFKPLSMKDLQSFLQQYEQEKPLAILGVLSNSIIRDGGIEGVVIRLGREFAGIHPIDGYRIYAGAAALDVNVAETAANHSISGLEFLCGVPGSIGGALALNAGAYGGELKDCLVRADFIDRAGQFQSLTPDQLKMSYRHSEIPEGWIALGAVLQGRAGVSVDILAHMNDIRNKRAISQPIRAQTGGSTFKNPTNEELQQAGLSIGIKAWQLIDHVGGRGLKFGGAQMSEQHANFMINKGTATAQDLETLGEEIRRRVKDKFCYELEWEIARLGRPMLAT